MEKGEYEDILEELLQDEEGVVSLDTCELCGDSFAQGRFACGLCGREICRQCLAERPSEDRAVCLSCGGRAMSQTPRRSTQRTGPPGPAGAGVGDTVQSSLIASVAYDSASRTLRIEFHTGSIYEYIDVPDDEYRSLMDAPSKGQYFNSRIRNSYGSEQVR